MNNDNEIKWDSYGNPIFYPELDIEEPKHNLIEHIIKLINKIKWW
jgi:hypothetical protein